MRRLTILLLLAVTIIGMQHLIQCSSPLDNGGGPNPFPPTTDTLYIYDTVVTFDTTFIHDTVYTGDTLYIVDTLIVVDTVYADDTVYVYDTTIVVDTVFVGDTVIVIDTVVVTDTITVTDTLTIVDTVYVQDTCSTPLVCGRIAHGNHDIVWMLRNDAADYHLEFEATTEKDQPEQNLKVDIDGQIYDWSPVHGPELIVDQYLNENSTIRIWSTKPGAFGHAIDICLEITKL